MDTALAVASAACAVAVVALLLSLWLARRLRRLQGAQKAVLGGASHDMVDFAVSLQGRIDDLHRAVDEVATGLSRVDRRVDGAITNTAVVRYDAYEDTGGKQSASFAFLDATRTGTVVTAIQGRDYARIYVKDGSAARRPWRSRPRSRPPSNGLWPAEALRGGSIRLLGGKQGTFGPPFPLVRSPSVHQSSS